MSMLHNPIGPTARKYLEFIINRAACACGGEHLWLRYNEATYDYFFHGVDWEWQTVKQCNSQMMLVFYDKELYCLCVYFAFGIYFLHGGLERHDTEEHAKDYVFPYLFSMKQIASIRNLPSQFMITLTCRPSTLSKPSNASPSLHLGQRGRES